MSLVPSEESNAISALRRAQELAGSAIDKSAVENAISSAIIPVAGQLVQTYGANKVEDLALLIKTTEALSSREKQVFYLGLYSEGLNSIASIQGSGTFDQRFRDLSRIADLSGGRELIVSIVNSWVNSEDDARQQVAYTLSDKMSVHITTQLYGKFDLNWCSVSKIAQYLSTAVSQLERGLTNEVMSPDYADSDPNLPGVKRKREKGVIVEAILLEELDESYRDLEEILSTIIDRTEEDMFDSEDYSTDRTIDLEDLLNELKHIDRKDDVLTLLKEVAKVSEPASELLIQLRGLIKEE